MLSEVFANRPFGASGEMLTAPAAEPPAPPAQRLEIEPPEWPSVVRTTPQADELSALAEMKLASGDVDEPPAPGPPIVMAPLTRPMIPAVDWRQEQREQAARELEPIQESPRSLQARPA